MIACSSEVVVLTWEGTLDSKRHGKNDHQGLVGHGINDAAGHGLQLPSPRQPAVDQVGEAGVGEQRESPFVVVMQEEVRRHGRGHQTRDGEEVGQVVDVLARRQAGEGGAHFVPHCDRALSGSFYGLRDRPVF